MQDFHSVVYKLAKFDVDFEKNYDKYWIDAFNMNQAPQT